MDCLLEVSHLQTERLGPLSLRLQPGELVQITGASGAGKSLLLRAIADLDPNGGEVWLDGQARDALTPPQWRRQVAYVPAETAWWGDRVDEHLPADWARDDAESFLEHLGLEHGALDWEVERLSSGEKQRLGLLRALLTGPRVLLLDEPTANLDLENTRRFERLVRAWMAEREAGALWVTHDTQQRDRLGGRILNLNDGRPEGTSWS